MRMKALHAAAPEGDRAASTIRPSRGRSSSTFSNPALTQREPAQGGVDPEAAIEHGFVAWIEAERFSQREQIESTEMTWPESSSRSDQGSRTEPGICPSGMWPSRSSARSSSVRMSTSCTVGIVEPVLQLLGDQVDSRLGDRRPGLSRWSMPDSIGNDSRIPVVIAGVQKCGPFESEKAQKPDEPRGPKTTLVVVHDNIVSGETTRANRAPAAGALHRHPG